MLKERLVIPWKKLGFRELGNIILRFEENAGVDLILGLRADIYKADHVIQCCLGLRRKNEHCLSKGKAVEGRKVAKEAVR